MKKVIRLTESDLTRIVKRVLNEQLQPEMEIPEELTSCPAIQTAMTLPGCQSTIISLMSGKIPESKDSRDCITNCMEKSIFLFTSMGVCVQNYLKNNKVSY
jgi:hypothetical protein